MTPPAPFDAEGDFDVAVLGGGLPAEVIIQDDQLNPESGKQIADRMVKQNRVDFLTGIVFSNVMTAVAPAVFESQTFLVSANSTPTLYSGEGCSPWFFSTSWQNDGAHEAGGKTCSAGRWAPRVATMSAANAVPIHHCVRA